MGEMTGWGVQTKWGPADHSRSLASFLKGAGHLCQDLTRGVMGSDFFFSKQDYTTCCVESRSKVGPG